MMVTFENYRRSRARAKVGASTFISRSLSLTVSPASIRAACVRLACMLVLASSANAADISVSKLDSSGRVWVTFEGDIVPSDVLQFHQKTSTISKAIVVMRSNGGSVFAGIEIGKIIRLRNYMTLVPDNASCASACAIAWLGGTTRYMAAKARIGFHAAFYKNTGQEAGVGNALIGSYLSQIGLPDRAVIYVTQASPKSMTWLTMSDAQERGIEVSIFASPRDQPPIAEPRERDRKDAERLPASVEVGQRVVLYEEEPDDPAGKRFVGTVLWRTEIRPASRGRPPELAVRGDVEVPERKMSVTLSFRRNTDASLPASHTVEIVFTLPPDTPSGGILKVPGVLMKQAEQTRGVPLAGLAVPVTPGYFLIGLSSLESDIQRNVQLLKERSWFDIPIIYNNDRRAILALEKGTPGEQAFNQAFAAWGSKYPTATTVQPEPATPKDGG